MKNMFQRMVVQKTLNQIWASVNDSELTPDNSSKGQDSVISRMIHDVFGGEILKTRLKNSWHFYNRIEGERIDFSLTEVNKSAYEFRFEDIPATPAETNNYFEQEDYSAFYLRFVREFEEVVGLGTHSYTQG